ncbi:MAG: hypothetical protein QOH90_275 [Actinomycetota bacterium]|nr:hypothetical protein [Actinomycetota bacterium]
MIAEAGSNHNRDLATALKLIEVAAGAGADAVKFQTYRAEGIYSRHTPNMSYLTEEGLLQKDETVWDLIKRVEIPWEWHDDLAEHARTAGVDFLSTPFEEEAVDVLEKVDVPAYKIASYEITHLPLIQRCAATGKPLLISTGMASLSDIERALDAANDAGATDIMLMHCAINYPPRFEDLNLRAISTLAQAFQIPIGWSDHTFGHTAPVVAVALGACAVEKHFTLDRDQEGPDHAFALEPDALESMIVAIRETEASLGSPVKRATENETEMYQKGRRSLGAGRRINVVDPVTADDVAVTRPGYGIQVHEFDILIGHKATRTIEEDEVLTWDDFR